MYMCIVLQVRAKKKSARTVKERFTSHLSRMSGKQPAKQDINN